MENETGIKQTSVYREEDLLYQAISNLTGIQSSLRRSTIMTN
jgi:hypothetical protein